MLIKPLRSKESIKSLPSKSGNPQFNHPAYFGSKDENLEFLESEGRLLMLPIMYEEFWNKVNKRIHDSNGKCIETWAICTCTFAKSIRMKDIGGKNWKLDW